ncbi:LysR family transcriptional regulator [Siccirubricoccus sp. G192]|uniref:LysR family transcriptional regulator n=1 Tax=Siccirubricoccus sp. G192 TaxID=2849651 RepID=UPI001C2B81DD|nr:LysR family transcriptional regulator [Siccirubricoccus sp. G192]MBV1800206.1 LysR family transcriptional regulator [Siccirubricoccus sp. G192]
MAINLHLLRLFAMVARHRSFSRAAEALHVSQPSVSKGVRELEAQLGSRLLERGGPGGVTLTEPGRILAGHAATLFGAERAAEEDLAAFRGLRRGTLAIGASTTIATYLLPRALGAFHRQHPEVELRLTSANTRAIVDLLLARELDIALVEGPVEEPGLVVEPWREDEMVLVASATHPLGAEAVLPDALAGQIVIMREPGSGTRDVGFEALAAWGVRPRRTLEVGSTEAIKQLVAAGVGVAIVSAAAAADQIALGRLRVPRLRSVSGGQVTLRRMLSRLILPGRRPSVAAAAFEALLGLPPETRG